MLRRLHSLVGLTAAALVVVMAISGAILSLNPVIERAGASIPSVGALSVADLASRVAVIFPGVERIQRKASGAIVVSYFDPDQPGAAFVDPASGKAIAPYAPSGFTRFVTNLHRKLFLDDTGRAAAGVGAAAMLVLTLSGLAMMARRLGGWRSLFGRIRGSTVQRVHGEIGRFTMAGLMLSATTGVFMSLVTFGVLPDGEGAQLAMPTSALGAEAMPVGAMKALQVVDLSDLRELSFPYPDDPTDVFTLKTATGEGYLDRTTGKLIAFQPNSAMRRVYETIFMLHTGEGLWWLGLVLGLSALSVPVMAGTGIVIFAARRRGLPKILGNATPGKADTVILVGSEGNSTWGFAAELHRALRLAGFAVHIAPMNRLARAYPSAERLLILTATYGAGEAPASAADFLGRLQNFASRPAVAVLGFGDRQFPDFCAYAGTVAETLEKMGCPTLLPLTSVDRQSPETFAQWGDALAGALGRTIELVHTPIRPATVAFRLVERVDYGDDRETATVVLRFEPSGRQTLWSLFACHGGLPRFAVGDLVGIVPPGSPVPRFYSLASSRADAILEICVRKHVGGLCSGLLTGLEKGDEIRAFIRPNPNFRPTHGAAPVILIGAGTGIGPPAGFIRHNSQHRPMYPCTSFGVR